MKSFARVTKLGNVGGRSAYVRDEKRQESILAESAPVDWKPYQEFERAHQRTDTANNEGREIVIALPNDWAELSRQELARRVQSLAVAAVGKETDMEWAVHWNQKRTNLHAHVIFSERTRDTAAGVYDRDVYHTADGKVARRKADRAKNPDGTDKPPVHRKGESKGGFTAKDTRYKSRSWLESAKERLQGQFRAYGVEIAPSGAFHEYHEGKGGAAAAIRAKNEIVRAQNKLFAEYRQKYPEVKESVLRRHFLQAMRRGEVTVVYRDKGSLKVGSLPLDKYRGEFQTAAALDSAVAAYGEVWKQRYYLLDKRPAEPDGRGRDALALPGRLKEQLAVMESAYSDYMDAFGRKVGFFDRKGKAERQADMDGAHGRFKRAAEVIAPHTATPLHVPMVSDYRDWLTNTAQKALERAERAARDVQSGLRGNTPVGSPEACTRSVECFRDACRAVPPEYRESLLKRLLDAPKGFQAPDASLALQARHWAEEQRRQILPTRQEQERLQQQRQAKEKPRSRGFER